MPSEVQAVVERPRDEDPEERADLGAGDEVVTGPPGATARREEGVERRGLERGEGDRPRPVDLGPEALGGASVWHDGVSAASGPRRS